MMTLVVVTRLHNAAAAAAGMRRGLDYARAFASARQVAGGRLEASPLSLGPFAKALREEVATVRKDPAALDVVAGARGCAMRLAHGLTAALLLDHARDGSWAGGAAAADLWTRRWLSHEDIAAGAADAFDELFS